VRGFTGPVNKCQRLPGPAAILHLRHVLWAGISVPSLQYSATVAGALCCRGWLKSRPLSPFLFWEGLEQYCQVKERLINVALQSFLHLD